MTAPIKLIDLGSGLGRLAEFAVAELIDLGNLPVMGGATASVAGTAGVVPAPPAGSILSYLARDGSWKSIADIPGVQDSTSIQYISSISYDTLLANGLYYCHSMSNAPTATSTYLQVIVINSNFVKQIAYDLVTANIYTRQKVGGTWSGWTAVGGGGGSVGSWTNLSGTFASGTIAFGNTPQCRLNGDRVEFRGGVGKSGGFSGAGNSLLTLSSTFRPAYATGGITVAQVTLNPSGNTVIGALTIDNSGLLQYSVSGGGLNGGGISLECLSYTTSA